VVFASCLLPLFAYKQPAGGRGDVYKVFRCGFCTVLSVEMLDAKIRGVISRIVD
jgi:hypothetical protein